LTLKDCLDGHATEQPFRRSKKVFQMEKDRKSVESFINRSMEVIVAASERKRRGEEVDLRSVTDVVRDVRDLVGFVILELGCQAARLEQVRLDMERLRTRANDVMLHSGSKYNMAENAEIVFRLDNEIQNLLLREFADIDVPCSGRKQLLICSLARDFL